MKRPYDSTGRHQRALQVRAHLVDIARRRFLTDGFARTTVAAIAAEAEVSVETVYKAFGGKPGLLRAIRDNALLGAGPIPAEQRSDEMRDATTDPRIVIRNWGILTTEVSPLVAPVLLLVRQASDTDPEIAALRREMDADRLARMTTNARYLQDDGHLRPEVTLARAADVLWFYSSPELYELLVLLRGWSLDDYGRWVSEGMIAALLP